jgi:hypothetical protein
LLPWAVSGWGNSQASPILFPSSLLLCPSLP